MFGMTKIHAQETASNNVEKHLIIYRADNYSIGFNNYKIWVNKEMFKVKASRILDLRILGESVKVIAGVSEPNGNTPATNILLSPNENIYFRASVNQFGQNITEVSKLTFLLETFNGTFPKEVKEIQ